MISVAWGSVKSLRRDNFLKSTKPGMLCLQAYVLCCLLIWLLCSLVGAAVCSHLFFSEKLEEK